MWYSRKLQKKHVSWFWLSFFMVLFQCHVVAKLCFKFRHNNTWSGWKNSMFLFGTNTAGNSPNMFKISVFGATKSFKMSQPSLNWAVCWLKRSLTAVSLLAAVSPGCLVTANLIRGGQPIWMWYMTHVLLPTSKINLYADVYSRFDTIIPTSGLPALLGLLVCVGFMLIRQIIQNFHLIKFTNLNSTWKLYIWLQTHKKFGAKICKRNCFSRVSF